MIAQLDKNFIAQSKLKTIHRLFAYTIEGRPLTTKGRWFNSLLNQYFKLITKSKTNNELVSPIYIIGTGRSGTTILGKLLGMHQKVLFLNEPKAIWAYSFPGEDLIGSYCQDKASVRLLETDFSKKTQTILNNFYRKALIISSCKLIVDKYPELIFRIPWVKSLFPGSKFIFLYRDPYETINSITNWSKVHGIKGNKSVKDDWWGRNNLKWNYLRSQILETNLTLYTDLIKDLSYIENNPIEKAAIEWILTMDEGLKVLKTNRKDIYFMDYGELISGNINSLNNLLNFCGLEPDEKFHQYANMALTKRSRLLEYNLSPSVQNHFDRIQVLFSIVIGNRQPNTSIDG